jgi:hypothetical protein
VPPTISFDDFDTDPTSNVNDKDLDDCIRPLEQYSQNTATDTSLQRFLFECLRPRDDILRRLNGISSEMSHDEILALSSKLTNACREFSVHVKTRNDAESEVFRQNMTDLFLRRFLLCLHRPFASRARTNPSYYFSRKICLDSASLLLSPKPDEEFSRLLVLGGGIFKSRIIHVALALCSELLIDTEEQGSDSSSRGPSSYRKMLVDAVKESRWQFAQRMRLGETNVRLYMKLGLALSQAEYTTSGISLQQQMAQSAKDSLQMSYSTIQARSGTPASWLHRENILITPEVDNSNFQYGFDFNDILQTTDFAMDGICGTDSSFF